MEKTNNKVKIVSKYPAIHDKPGFNEIYVRGNRPLPVYKKHSHKVLTKHNVIIIHAMTAAINKAVELYLYLKKEYPYLREEITTDSVLTIVELEGSNEKQLREKSAIHIVLTKVCDKIEK